MGSCSLWLEPWKPARPGSEQGGRSQQEVSELGTLCHMEDHFHLGDKTEIRVSLPGGGLCSI